jgi:hypothetical protein
MGKDVKKNKEEEIYNFAQNKVEWSFNVIPSQGEYLMP